jgi:hypothetical protein
MAGINLLPIDLSPNRGSVKTSTSLKKGIVILSGIFVLVVLLGIIFIVFLTSELNNSIAKQKNFTQNIKSLEGTEQKLFLIKDRIGKIKLAQNSKDADSLFNPLSHLLSNLPNGVSISTVEVDPTKTKFAVNSTNSLDAASFLNTLVTSGTYKKLILTGFSYTPETGYAITLEGS